MNIRQIIIVFGILFLISIPVSSRNTELRPSRILFYEVGTSDKFKIERDYSEFAQVLRDRGHTVASITRGELSKDALQNYDILVIQELGKPLSTEEISSIIWFVLQKGKGLMINGAGEGNANQISIPFGVTVDTGVLIDTEDQIGEDRTNFVVDRFEDHPELRTVKAGVLKVGFYGGRGLFISGNTKCVLTGDSDTYSDTGSFPTGSRPCVAAASLFGNGLVFAISDVESLSNENIQMYNNQNFGLNVIDWLSIPSISTGDNQTIQGLQVLIGELKLENAKLKSDIERLTIEKATLETLKQQLEQQIAHATQEIFDLKSEMIGPFTKSNWALIFLGFCLIISAVIFSKKKDPGSKPMEEDVLSELGYELDDSSKSDDSDESSDDLGDLGI